MRRLFAILAVAVAVAVAVAWIANRQGMLVYTIDGYEVSTSAGGAIGIAILFAATVGLLTRFWTALIAGPDALGGWFRLRRARRGQDALSRGLVAAAAGDALEAQRQARKAHGLLGQSPLGLLLTAQAAQLEGDGVGQRTAYRAMLNHPETEFLGLRGLFMDAMRREDSDEAMKLAERAHTLKPKAAWAVNALFDLKSARGDWTEAKVVLDDAARARLIDADVAKRRRAVLLAAEALDVEGADGERALKLALQALDLSPGLAPAAVLAARKLARDGRAWRAQDIIEAAWSQSPHPDLAAAYAAIRTKETAEERAQRLTGLAHLKRDHFESRLLEAEENVNLANWGEARRVLAPLAQGFASARVCALMAEIEQGLRHDAAAAHAWLERAVRAPRDAEWRCEACGWSSPQWRAVCGRCAAFDTLSWSAPVTGGLQAYSPAVFDDGPAAELSSPLLESETRAEEKAKAETPPPRPAGRKLKRDSDEAGFVVLPRAPDDPGPDGEEFDNSANRL
ncbi:MAG: tetratricopeptide repeat protein [Alphaproteobacteria bacterium]|nr:tetratricopeptide repeat protein [Alphaproteobacteria bacterium]MBU6471424.1 tetratricopeptide repeat protein [Alphaproteobacteria bacterium]MDE2012884.1 tetratricopeptide repeat protein [Alphaproteobacteria bacterium]MDE2073408.1 tetratricopeptide repeat protein [Alphaproteobacteria bacterium]MDE2350703.1 tetratricopeptide repeat protein [Alphaproteobacteria bacterium]